MEDFEPKWAEDDLTAYWLMETGKWVIQTNNKGNAGGLKRLKAVEYFGDGYKGKKDIWLFIVRKNRSFVERILRKCSGTVFELKWNESKRSDEFIILPTTLV